MRLTLSWKVALVLGTLVVSMALVFLGVSTAALRAGFGRYVGQVELSRFEWLAQRLEAAHAEDHGWQSLVGDPMRWHRMQMYWPQSGDPGRRPPRGEGPPDRPPAPREGEPPHAMRPPGLPPPQLDVLPSRFAPPPPPDARSDPRSSSDNVYSRLALLDADGKLLLGADTDASQRLRRPLHDASGGTIGFLGLAPLHAPGGELERAFIAEQIHRIWLIAAGGLLLAAGSAWLLMKVLLAPIRRLTAGTRAVAEGDFAIRLPVAGSDELARLTDDFNAMATHLERGEQARSEWIANTSHELRTPLAVLRAEVEALQDGVRQADTAAFDRLLRHVLRLERLVEDLRLTLAGTPEQMPIELLPMQPAELLLDMTDAIAPRFEQAGIELRPAIVPTITRDAIAIGDAHRLQQVFGNLLENSLRYTSAPGRLEITIAGSAREIAIRFDDTPPCPPPEHLPRLFERLFRGEASRSRDRGGSGLGLAICKTLVEAHGGRITIAQSPLGGLRVEILLPRTA